MKKLIAIAILYGLMVSAQAQNINYTIENIAHAGEEFHVETKTYDEATMTQLNNIDAEAWDFSTINTLEKSMVQVLSKNDFQELAELPEGTLVMVRDQYKICMLPEDNYLKMLGILADIEGTNVPMLFPEPQKMLHFPLTVGEGDESSFSFPISGKPSDFGLNIPLTDSVKFMISISSSTYVESIGTLATYQYSYEAFKVLNTNILSADIWAKTAFTGWFLYEENAIADSMKMLQYFMPQYGIPVCEITMNWNNEIKTFQIIDETPGNIGAQEEQLFAYPNPATIDDILYLSHELTDVNVFDASGQQVLHFERTKTINTNNFHPGLYIISAENHSQNIKILIR